MRPLYFFLTFILIHTISTAQVANLVFIGSVSVNDGRNYPYKLYVTDSEDIVTGYSVTDILGADETKTYIRGKIDRKSKQLTFKETHIQQTKSKIPVGDFCFIHARLKTGSMQGATTLKGNFTGYKPDGKTECGKGKIILVCAQDALARLMKIAEKEGMARPGDTTESALPSMDADNDVPESSVRKIEPGETIILKCPDKDVTVEIWDAKTLDGDRVTLFSGENKLLSGYMITNEHKRLQVQMGDEKSVRLRLVADTEGSLPVNTARIKIASRDKSYYIDASTIIGKDVNIILERK
ncbi:MAG: hypothetical protein KF744_07170 [Taibaiella sp.]|nr:hypothetical protein [Taibaiella sp.]